MNDDIYFSVTQKDGVTRFINNTSHTLYVSIKPIKPKRKHITILIVKPDSFIFYERELPIDKLSFSLE